MTVRLLTGMAMAVAMALIHEAPGRAQAPIDTSKIGPQVGTTVPEVSGVDQFGTPRSLASVSGPKGAMLVFFRSADW